MLSVANCMWESCTLNFSKFDFFTGPWHSALLKFIYWMRWWDIDCSRLTSRCVKMVLKLGAVKGVWKKGSVEKSCGSSQLWQLLIFSTLPLPASSLRTIFTLNEMVLKLQAGYRRGKKVTGLSCRCSNHWAMTAQPTISFSITRLES